MDNSTPTIPQNPPSAESMPVTPNPTTQVGTIQPSVMPAPPPKTNRSKIIKIVIFSVIGLIILSVVVGLFLSRSSKGGMGSSAVWNPGEVDSSLFTGQRYNSGDVYLGSCFESGVPKNFEITSIGFLPKIGVVKPIGPKVDGNYYPYIDIRFHENQNPIGEELLSESNYPELKSYIEGLTGGTEVTDRKVSFTTIKLFNKTSKAIIVEYRSSYPQPITTYDGRSVQDVSLMNVFVMGKNPKIVENIKLAYEEINKERDIKMFKEYLKTFKPTCYAESDNF